MIIRGGRFVIRKRRPPRLADFSAVVLTPKREIYEPRDLTCRRRIPVYFKSVPRARGGKDREIPPLGFLIPI